MRESQLPGWPVVLAPIFGWHFTGDTLRDGRPLPAIGETLVHDGPIVMCKAGLHGSEKLADALSYAPGPIVWRCRFEGIEDREASKFVCRRRTGLWRFDATDLLWADARESAKTVLHLWDAPDIVRRFLDTGDETLRDAARGAAADAARDAAWAARDAAWAATAAARDAAWAAEDAARAAHNERLTAAVIAAAKQLGIYVEDH